VPVVCHWRTRKQVSVPRCPARSFIRCTAAGPGPSARRLASAVTVPASNSARTRAGHRDRRGHGPGSTVLSTFCASRCYVRTAPQAGRPPGGVWRPRHWHGETMIISDHRHRHRHRDGDDVTMTTGPPVVMVTVTTPTVTGMPVTRTRNASDPKFVIMIPARRGSR
jgi:hypothetical protein